MITQLPMKMQLIKFVHKNLGILECIIYIVFLICTLLVKNDAILNKIRSVEMHDE